MPPPPHHHYAHALPPAERTRASPSRDHHLRRAPLGRRPLTHHVLPLVTPPSPHHTRTHPSSSAHLANAHLTPTGHPAVSPATCTHPRMTVLARRPHPACTPSSFAHSMNTTATTTTTLQSSACQAHHAGTAAAAAETRGDCLGGSSSALGCPGGALSTPGGRALRTPPGWGAGRPGEGAAAAVRLQSGGGWEDCQDARNLHLHACPAGGRRRVQPASLKAAMPPARPCAPPPSRPGQPLAAPRPMRPARPATPPHAPGAPRGSAACCEAECASAAAACPRLRTQGGGVGEVGLGLELRLSAPRGEPTCPQLCLPPPPHTTPPLLPPRQTPPAPQKKPYPTPSQPLLSSLDTKLDRNWALRKSAPRHTSAGSSATSAPAADEWWGGAYAWGLLR